MVTSIVLTGMYNIGISSNNKIKTPNGVLVDVKDIPFVRYRFEKYGDEELQFIINNKKKFPCVHVVEITFDENTVELLNKIIELDDMIAKMVYIDVSTEEITSGFSDEKIELIGDLRGEEYDRLVLRDKTSSLYQFSLNRLKAQVKKAVGIKESEIGVCGGPCCFINGNACLTAVKAREILTTYSEQDDSVVPTANHEGKMELVDNMESCLNKCGCIRYHVFNSDTDAPTSKSSGSKKNKVKINNTEVELNESEKEPKQKVVKRKGYTKVVW